MKPILRNTLVDLLGAYIPMAWIAAHLAGARRP